MWFFRLAENPQKRDHNITWYVTWPKIFIEGGLFPKSLLNIRIMSSALRIFINDTFAMVLVEVMSVAHVTYVTSFDFTWPPCRSTSMYLASQTSHKKLASPIVRSHVRLLYLLCTCLVAPWVRDCQWLELIAISVIFGVNLDFECDPFIAAVTKIVTKVYS